MVQVGVMGNQENPLQTVEWTLEHHKLFVDLLLHSGSRLDEVRAFILKKMTKTVKGLTWSAASDHSRHLETLQKKTQALLLLPPPPRKHSCNLNLLVEDLVRDLEGLKMELKPSTWTLEHHKRVVDALVRVGGLNWAAGPIGKTAIKVLRLMEEDHRQGLTTQTLMKHLIGLRYLQRRTQEAIVKRAENKAKYGSRKVKLMGRRRRRKNDHNRLAEGHGLSDHMLL